MPAPVSRFVNLRESETEREHLVLLAHRPGTREVESFTQPQHGLEPPDRVCEPGFTHQTALITEPARQPKLGGHRALRAQQADLAEDLLGSAERHPLARYVPAGLHADRSGRVRGLLHALGTVLDQ